MRACTDMDPCLLNLQSMIDDAHFTAVNYDIIQLPWEQPPLSMVLGEQEEEIVPKVMPLVGCFDRPPPDSDKHAESSVRACLKTRATAYECAISFESRRTEHLPLSDQLELALRKWDAAISISYGSFELGLDIEYMEPDQRMFVLSQVLAGKATSTINRRYDQLGKYVGWATTEGKEPFPVTKRMIVEYVRHLVTLKKPHSAYSGFVEVMKFSKHVMGLKVDLDAFQEPWVQGVFRGASQVRPLRKQSTTLTVKALCYLEELLENENWSAVDRFAVGVFLFATYARARFGDLKEIAAVIIDQAEPGSRSLGYLELHSASHKLRAVGSRLGSHLPLIAPIKGLGPGAWGRSFVKISKLVGLDLMDWKERTPLLPAPTVIGDWMDRATTNSEIGKWIKELLKGCEGFDPVGFTPHGCKATTLAMLARYGASPDVRLLLGHHQTSNGAMEVYSRDLQAAPLRILEEMFEAIRSGRFAPDATRSGQIIDRAPLQFQDAQDTGAPSARLPTPERYTPLASPSEPNVEVDDLSLPSASPFEPSAVTQLQELNLTGFEGEPDIPELVEGMEPVSSDSSDSDSSSDSGDEPHDRVVEALAVVPLDDLEWKPGCKKFQHRKTKTIHAQSLFSTSFLCGRALTEGHTEYSGKFHVKSLLCQQCDKPKIRSLDDTQTACIATAKRARIL